MPLQLGLWMWTMYLFSPNLNQGKAINFVKSSNGELMDGDLSVTHTGSAAAGPIWQARRAFQRDTGDAAAEGHTERTGGAATRGRGQG